MQELQRKYNPCRTAYRAEINQFAYIVALTASFRAVLALAHIGCGGANDGASVLQNNA